MSRFLERLELRTNRAYWGDGLLDLFCAFALLAIGVAWLTDLVVFGAVVPALIIPLWKPLRQRFTEPRLGMVELAQAREDRNRAFVRLMLIAGCASFLLGLGVYLAHSFGLELTVIVVKAMPGVLVGLAGFATAEALQLRRFFVYAGVTVATAVVVAVAPELNPGWAFVTGGASALIGGAALARSFARRHGVGAAQAQEASP